MPLTKMPESDYTLVRLLCDAGVLQNISFEDISAEHVVGIFCPDGRRFGDMYQHAKNSCQRDIHPLTRHGGALLLASDSPFARRTVDDTILHCDLNLLTEIKEAMEIMETSRVLSFAHIPCKKALLFGLSAAEVLRLHVGAKVRVRGHIPGCTISCHVHVDYYGWPHKKRFATYFLNKNNLCSWLQTSEGAQYPNLQEVLAA